MPTKGVAEALQAHGLFPPDLEFLQADERRYTALLMQPSGPIFASPDRIGPFDKDMAGAKSKSFLSLARETGAQLAITPEYFMPWDSLKESIQAGDVPSLGVLWVLGCESTTEEDLETFKASFGQNCLFIHEPWEGLGVDRRVLDPVVLLFKTKSAAGAEQLVAIVQFKTCPSRDNVFLEEQILRRGTVIYRFSGATGYLSASVIICSDAFAIDDQAFLRELTDRSTLIHIQLNPSPRNSAYKNYRTQVFRSDSHVSNCHIICLNWAHLIVQKGNPGSKEDNWTNIAGSTWYCPKDRCSPADAVVRPNHDKGVYYTYLKEDRRHALLLDYEEAVYQFLVPKVMSLGRAVQVNMNGPSALNRYVWDEQTSLWALATEPCKGGFDKFLDENDPAKQALRHISGRNDPLAIERVLALSAGAIESRDDWYGVDNIDSFQLMDDEVVKRVTVVQDPKGDGFKHQRLNTVSHIQNELNVQTKWPSQVDGVGVDSIVQWDPERPNFNVMTADGAPTLIVYLGEIPPRKSKENKADMFFNLLRRAGGEHQHRFCLMYREYDQMRFVPISPLTRIDDGLDDRTDLAAVTPFDPAEEH